MTGKQTQDDRRLTRLSRRRFLAVTGTTTALAGCLAGDDESTDDDSKDDGSTDPEQPDPVDPDSVPGPGGAVVEDPPQGVYLPTHREAFEMLSTVRAGDFELMPHFTYAHTFWLMRGREREEVQPEPRTLHLMLAFRDAETGKQLPVGVGGTIEIRTDGERVVGPRTMWPMISQGMGFHFGDNVPFASADYDGSFPEEGTYEIDVTMDPIDARKTGAFEGRFEEQVTTSFEFEFSIDDFQRVTENVEFFAEDRWGDREAMSLRNPERALPPAAEYPGTDLGSYESGDADFVVRYLEESRLGAGGGYLFVSPRTPFNRIPLPDMTLSVEGDVEGDLAQTLDSELGHHYGIAAEISDGDEFDLVVETPPQIARHQGYETAFVEMPDLHVTVTPE